MTAPPSKAPGSPAVSTEASVWTALGATRAPALRASSVSTARATSTSASPGPATPQGALTASSWSTITSAAAAWDTLVHSCCLHIVLDTSPSAPVSLFTLHVSSSRSPLRVNGGPVLVQAVPQRRRLLHEHELCTRLRLLLSSGKLFLFFLPSILIRHPATHRVFLVAAKYIAL